MQRRIHGRVVQSVGLGDSGQVVSPARLEGHCVVRVQREAGTSNTGSERRTGGKIHRLKTHSNGLVTEIASGEVHVDALRGRHFEYTIHAIVLGRIAETLDTRPTIGNGVAQMVDY